MSRRSLRSAFYVVLKRDLLLAYRRRAEMINPLLFFVLVTALYPLSIGGNTQELASIGPGIIWVGALLASLLSIEGIFRSDFEDGSLDQLILSAHPVSLLIVAKVLAHWLVTGVPLIVISPLLGVMLSLDTGSIAILLVTLALGTPVLSFIGAIGVALTVGLHRGGIILALLVLPLYVPVLIFASSAVQTAAAGIPVTAQLYILSAMLVFALSLAPLATAVSLRISLS
jgi:heme exporter protein B